MNRRRFIRSLLIAGTGVIAPSLSESAPPARADKAKPGSEQQMVTPNEDLMREHGVLERILLIYEEAKRRGQVGKLPIEQLRDSAEIVRQFVEDYHEKLEENYVFPRFEKTNRLVDLVHTLKTQHDAGRRVTSEILRLTSGTQASAYTIRRMSSLISQFVRMYRPHYARDNTVLFPAFPGVAGAKEYRELGEKFEDQEHRLSGKSGFEGIAGKVAAIEKAVGIYDLSRFTPKL